MILPSNIGSLLDNDDIPSELLSKAYHHPDEGRAKTMPKRALEAIEERDKAREPLDDWPEPDVYSSGMLPTSEGAIAPYYRQGIRPADPS